MQKFRNRRCEGFVGVVFLAIALIGIVIAAIAAMSRSSSSGTSSETLKANVSVLLKQSSDIKSGFDRMVVDGIVADPYAITINNNATTGLFSTANGRAYSVSHIPPRVLGPSVLINAAGFNYNATLRLPGIGAANVSDYVITTQIKDLAACQMINKILYGDQLSATPAVSSDSKSMWATRYGTFNDSSNVSVNYASRPEGCVKTSDGVAEYVYYKAMIEG